MDRVGQKRKAKQHQERTPGSSQAHDTRQGRIASAIGVALIILPLIAPTLIILLFAGFIALDAADAILPRAKPSLALGPKSLDAACIGGEVGATDQVDAIGDGGHHRVQAIADGAGLAGQVDDQSAPADASGLPR